MWEADALLDAIFDNPDDDTPRLVYADWLQEHGHEDCAEFIRISVFLKRNTLHPDERAQLRRQRHQLRVQISKAFEASSHINTYNHPDDGIPSASYTVEASAFLKEWTRWGYLIRPRGLALWDLCGYESSMCECEYLKRVTVLTCEGVGGRGWGHERDEVEWQPVSGVLLSAIVNSPHLNKLEALEVEPLLVSANELLHFADTSLAQQLDELRLWVQFPDGSREDLLAMKGILKEQIQAFVAEHTMRFIPVSGS